MALLQQAVLAGSGAGRGLCWQALQAAAPLLNSAATTDAAAGLQQLPWPTHHLQFQQQQQQPQQQYHHWRAQTSLQTRPLSSSSSSSSSNSRAYHSAASRSRHLPEIHGTTVLCVRKDDQVVLIADGQITAGPKVVKPNARKLRRLATEPQPSLGGFAGSTADGLTLFERLEQRLEEHPGQLRRAAVELAKAWRQDRILRHLEAVMIVTDATTCLEVSGKGELLEPADNVHAIGSGSRFAVAAARALMTTALPPLEIAQRAMAISAARCVYTNSNWVWEVITADGQVEAGSTSGNSSSTSSSNGNSNGSKQ